MLQDDNTPERNADEMARALWDSTPHSDECPYATPHLMDGDDRCDCDRNIRAMLAYAKSLSPAEGALRAEVETWASINQWCDDTFGLATVPQIIARAAEEWVELEDAAEVEDIPAAAIEAADVVICLCRIPGFAEALQRKMAINRARKWRLVGNGTGYHIPEVSALTPTETGEQGK